MVKPKHTTGVFGKMSLKEKPLSKELGQMTPLMDILVRMSIKYQADLASMTIDEVFKLVSPNDWKRIQEIMKYGKKVH